MSTLSRYLIAGLIVVALIGAGALLLRGGVYGLTLFLLLPVCLGALAAWLVGPETGVQAAGAGAIAAMVASGSFFILGADGAICVLMSWPLVIPLGAIAGWLFYKREAVRIRKRPATMLLLIPVVTLGWDVEAPPPVFAVRTTVEIAATPQQIWNHVVTFSELPEPHEWFFRAGLAYPRRARIEGSGAGAVRYCDFSTGPFVEPIEVWDAPRLLRFRVTESPAPMHEWSPYAQVVPKHLHGYLISKQGQFRLTALPGNRTLLEGTTWYQHGLWPAQYWRLWSDAIIHRIHLRVLTHIRTLAEGRSAQSH
jgi:hypothetical protein